MSQVGLGSRGGRWEELDDAVGGFVFPSLDGSGICVRLGRGSSVTLVVASFLNDFLNAFSIFLILT